MIACDIVLIPPEHISDKAIRFNRELIEKGRKEIILDEERCLPHITLAMGCIKMEDLDKIDGVLGKIAQDLPPVVLKTVSDNSVKAWMRIEKNKEIVKLHKIIMKKMSPFFSHKVSEKMIYGHDKENIGRITTDYIKWFKLYNLIKGYTPHITVGYGKMNIKIKPVNFTAKKLALCHLGNYCTCRKVILSYDLLN